MNILPKEVVEIVEKYRKENNPGNKFLKLLTERKEIYTYDCYVTLFSLGQYFKTHSWPIEIRSGFNPEIHITGELPLITEDNLTEMITILIRKTNAFRSNVLNWLLKEAGSKLRAVPVSIFKDGKLLSFHNGQFKEFEYQVEIVNIS